MTGVDHDVDLEFVGVMELNRLVTSHGIADFRANTRLSTYRIQDDSIETSPSPTISTKTDSCVYPVTSIHALEEDAPVNAVSLPPTVRDVALSTFAH